MYNNIFNNDEVKKRVFLVKLPKIGSSRLLEQQHNLMNPDYALADSVNTNSSSKRTEIEIGQVEVDQITGQVQIVFK